MVRLVALDMDGTLLNSRLEISEANKKAIALACENGARIVLCSGRPIKGLVKYIEELGLYNDEEFLIGFNGALVVQAKSKKRVYEQGMSGKDAKILARTASEIGANYIIHFADHAMTPVENFYSTLEATVNGIPLVIGDPETIDDHATVMKVLFLDYEHILEGYLGKIPEAIRQKHEIVRTAPFFLEFLDKGLSKYSALSALARELGIGNEEVMAIGDSENDYEMVKYSGVGVAMGNATDALKKAAKLVTRTEDEDGVAYALNRVMNLGMEEFKGG